MQLGRRVLLSITAAVTVLAASLSAVSATATSGLEGIPHYDHVVVLILENESYAASFTTLPAPDPYIRSLAAAGVHDDQYFGTGHVSLDNYVAMVSGQPLNPATSSDCLSMSLFACVQNQTVWGGTAADRNLGDQLDAASVTWKGYVDGTSAPCVHDVYSVMNPATPDSYQGNGATVGPNAGKDYADRHNPFIYFADIVGNDARCQAHVRPYSELATDISGNALPGFSFISPDTCHDGHDTPCSAGGGPGGLASADAFTQSVVPGLMTYLNAHNGLLIVTFDEATPTDTSGCCHGGPGGQMGAGGRVGLIALGPGVKTGVIVHTPYDHASMLRTVEDSFGINEYLNNAASSVPMRDLFQAPAVIVPENVGASQLLLVAALLVAAAAFLAGRRRSRRPA